MIINVLILGLFLYSKLLPYENRLDKKFKKVFNFFDSLLKPILNFLKKIHKPYQVGVGLSVDMSQILLLILLLILLNLI